MEPSNLRKKKPLYVTKELSNVIMEPLNVRKNKGITKCEKRTVKCDVRTTQC